MFKKVENLEQNISKIEETSYILPKIEQKFENFRKLHKEKLEVIKSAVQLLHGEVNTVIQTLEKNDRQSLSELNTSQSLFTTGATMRGDTRRLTFTSLLNSIQNEELKEIIEQLHPNKLILPLIQRLMRCVYVLSMEQFYNKVTRNVAFFIRFCINFIVGFNGEKSCETGDG